MEGKRRQFVTVVGAAALGGLALLIWAKLRMVAGVPRTALADPKQVMRPQPPAPASRPQPGPPAGDTDRRDRMGD
jgi:hypothetical protein